MRYRILIVFSFFLISKDAFNQDFENWKWKIGASYGYSGSYRQKNTDTYYSDLDSIYLTSYSEHQTTVHNFGFDIQRQINPRISVSSGIFFNNFGKQGTIDETKTNTNVLLFRTEFKTVYSYLTIPLSSGINIVRSKNLRFDIFLGLNLHYLSSTATVTKSYNVFSGSSPYSYGAPIFLSGSKFQEMELRPINFSLHFSPAIDFRISPKSFIRFYPQFTWLTGNVGTGTNKVDWYEVNNKEKFYNFGFNISYNYILSKITRKKSIEKTNQ